jgi:peptidoglycan/LPS O-acetylase OafA/YrhL
VTGITSEARVSGSEPGGAKLLGLEVIRFTCAMAVLVWHYRHFAMIGDGGAMFRPHEPLGGLLWPFYHFGLFGVQIFWCVSGFIFYFKYAAAIAERRCAPRRYFWLRLSRLYPLHFATLLIVAALQPLYVALAGQPFVFKDISATSFLLQLGMADQWGGPRPMSFNGPIWSVSAEVFVYVGFFAALRCFGVARWLIAAAVGAGLASIWSGATSPALICAGYFFAGGAAAQWMRHAQGRGRMAEARRTAMALLVAVGVGAMLVDASEPERILPTLIMAGCPPLLLIAAQDWRLLDRWPRLIQAAGNLTYSTYLIHFPIQLGVAIVALAGGIALPVGEAWFLIAYLAAAIVLGRVIFERFEAPMQQWIRAATLRPEREQAAA